VSSRLNSTLLVNQKLLFSVDEVKNGENGFGKQEEKLA